MGKGIIDVEGRRYAVWAEAGAEAVKLQSAEALHELCGGVSL